MWKLEKPSLESAKDDLLKVTGIMDLPAFEALYEEYDINNGKISEEYHRDFLDKNKDQSCEMYKQYDKLNEGGKLDYIRAELFNEAPDCPLCGFGEPVTLDHFMPKSKYKELATCRLNLVPICWNAIIRRVIMIIKSLFILIIKSFRKMFNSLDVMLVQELVVLYYLISILMVRNLSPL